MEARANSVLAFLTALLLLIFAIAGCASSSATAPSASGSGGQTQGCLTTTSFTGGDRSSRTAILLARTDDPVSVPDDIDVSGSRPTDLNQGDQSVWVDQSTHDEQQNKDNAPAPPPAATAPTTANLDAEGDAIGPVEELALLGDDDTSGDEYDFGEEVCEAVEQLIQSGDDLDSVQNVVDDIQQLTPISPSGEPSGSSGSPSGNGAEAALTALQTILNSAAADFSSVFGPCEPYINVAEWLLDTIQKVFCPGTT